MTMNATNKRHHVPVRRPGDVGFEESTSQEAKAPEEPALSALNRTPLEEAVDWRDTALRLRAEMDNYRKRQQRLADEQIVAEKKRLLMGFLQVLDNFERIIQYLKLDNPYYQSVKATYDDMLKMLRVEGVEPIIAVGTLFDPMLHDAVALIPAQQAQEEDMLVIQEEQKGYRIGDQVLRPARVIVAKRR
jgi:molecular chaperone GrpE